MRDAQVLVRLPAARAAAIPEHMFDVAGDRAPVEVHAYGDDDLALTIELAHATVTFVGSLAELERLAGDMQGTLKAVP